MEMEVSAAEQECKAPTPDAQPWRPVPSGGTLGTPPPPWTPPPLPTAAAFKTKHRATIQALPGAPFGWRELKQEIP